MKWNRLFLIALVYAVFTLLYTLYITSHLPAGTHWPSHTGHGIWKNADKRPVWAYFLEFLLTGGYVFFIVQGIAGKSRNWGVLLLFPIAIFVATIFIGFILVGLVRLGGGDLLDSDKADMILASAVFVTLSVFARKWVVTRKG